MGESSKDQADIAILREILARELETINLYQSMLARTESPDIDAFISHIIDEEKEHVAESMELINSLDPAQASRFGFGSHWRKSPTASGQLQAGPANPPDHQTPGQSFTVGSLRGEKRG